MRHAASLCLIVLSSALCAAAEEPTVSVDWSAVDLASACADLTDQVDAPLRFAWPSAPMPTPACSHRAVDTPLGDVLDALAAAAGRSRTEHAGVSVFFTAIDTAVPDDQTPLDTLLAEPGTYAAQIRSRLQKAGGLEPFNAVWDCLLSLPAGSERERLARLCNGIEKVAPNRGRVSLWRCLSSERRQALLELAQGAEGRPGPQLIMLLGRCAPDGVVPYLQELVQGSDDNLQSATATLTALAVSDLPAASRALLTAAKAELAEGSRRGLAVNRLFMIRHIDLIAELLPELEAIAEAPDDHRLGLSQLLGALAARHDDRVLPALTRIAREGGMTWAMLGYNAIARVDTAAAADRLLEDEVRYRAAEDPARRHVHQATLHALMRLESPAALDRLEAALPKADDDLAGLLRTRLLRAGRESAIGPSLAIVRAGLRPEADQDQSKHAQRLIASWPPSAADRLGEELWRAVGDESLSEQLRRVCLSALGRIDPKGYRERMVAIWDDPEERPALRATAFQSLAGGLTGPERENHLEAGLDDPAPAVRAAAAGMLLSRPGDLQKGHERILTLLREEESAEVRSSLVRQMVFGFRDLDDATATSVFEALVELSETSEDEALRRLAASRLRHLRAFRHRNRNRDQQAEQDDGADDF